MEKQSCGWKGHWKMEIMSFLTSQWPPAARLARLTPISLRLAQGQENLSLLLKCTFWVPCAYTGNWAVYTMPSNFRSGKKRCSAYHNGTHNLEGQILVEFAFQLCSQTQETPQNLPCSLGPHSEGLSHSIYWSGVQRKWAIRAWVKSVKPDFELLFPSEGKCPAS